ncbi:glutamate ABC transporter substrate-binding protein [Kitasatospora sp. NBC_01287]|uniref:glutamate ABC transporter substrate-binding protein n=1 Tax=Kitasatospora sp. NBC_01287 TaxID=2903573 RepID=UPI002251CA88|nr:glutamate ABC transporter substrate-binding protein [Kitasatospora sp. NBC_01287]MCX4746340.1 glutamate ABC transporter substrate-binding protein [Kitasatospora sp. NBC_01287]
MTGGRVTDEQPTRPQLTGRRPTGPRLTGPRPAGRRTAGRRLPRRVRALLLTAALLAPLALAGSAAGAPGRPAAGTRTAAAAGLLSTAQDSAQSCDPTKSLLPSGSDSGPAVSAIRKRGVLIAGVDQNNYHWGFRDPATGQVEGFDIDIVHAIAQAVLGDPNKVKFLMVPTAQRMEAIKSGQVDVIARTMTITCDRLNDVAFSTVYFQAGQQVVVPKSAHAKSVDDALRGKTVCVSDASTAQDQLKQNPRGAKAVKVVANDLDCLVLMQLGQVDATLTDNAIAVGQAAQDPTVQVIGPSITNEPYGVAMSKNSPDLVARVNQVLADYRADGGWLASYDKWLAPYLGPSQGPPPANYLP